MTLDAEVVRECAEISSKLQAVACGQNLDKSFQSRLSQIAFKSAGVSCLEARKQI